MKIPGNTLLAFSILMCGCFTESSMTRDEVAPEDSKVLFYLKDGSFVKSYAERHRRIEGGYEVSGTITRKGEFPETFDGIVLDVDILSWGVDDFNVVGTVLGIGVAAVAFHLLTQGLPGSYGW